MSTINQQTINLKVTTFMENLNLLLENTLMGGNIYIMNEKINFMKLTQTQYQNLIFEQELFDILLKNKYAVHNNLMDNMDEDDNIVYANAEYPFSLIICSMEARRKSILVNNIGLVLIKFILYLRMLNQNVARPDCPNCFLAINMKILPFGRICIDVDYKPIYTDDVDDDEYKRIVEKCFHIVCEMTTFGSIMMTRNCFTPNTRSFHLITEQQFDVVTRQVIFFKIAERIKALHPNISIDQVHVWMLPFGRGHVPFRKYNRKNNEFEDLNFPYTEMDFELTMPFDLNLGVDNLHTLFSIATEHDGDNSYDCGGGGEEEEYDVLNEFSENDIVCSYKICGLDDVYKNLQLYIKIASMKYDFTFGKQHNYRFENSYLPIVLGNKYNNFFLIVSNKKLIFENNWQIPKPKIQQRPTEFYEIYRFISHKLLNDLNCMEDLFKIIPSKLVNRNVNIGNVDEINNSSNGGKKVSSIFDRDIEINEVFIGNKQYNFTFHNTINNDVEMYENIQPEDDQHPWPYMNDSLRGLSSNASVTTKNVYEFFRNTITDNVYPYEKYGRTKIMMYFRNIQTSLNTNSDYFISIINNIYKVMINDDLYKIQKYIFQLYVFFCRVHYIDACISTDEYHRLQEDTLHDTIKLVIDEEQLERYRNNYVEMSPGKMAYKKFPHPGTPLAEIWNKLIPENKILLHIIYLMVVEHNYTTIFLYMQSIFKINDITYLMCSFFLNILDNSYIDSKTNRLTYSYASKEFLNFMYKTIIDAGPGVKCFLEDGNIQFNMVNLDSLIQDLQVMVIGSPIWFFLSNFQYVDETLDYNKRFDIFIQIFQQEQQQGRSSSSMNGENRSNGIQRGGMDSIQPPPTKKSKLTKTSTLNHDKYFKMYNINEMYQNDLLAIFYKYILSLCNTESGEYLYDGARFCQSTLQTHIKPRIIREPVKHSLIYRHQYGIYNTWTLQFERNTSVLYTNIEISNDEFAKFPELFNAYNDDIYKIMINRFLKSITFTRVLNYQKNLGLLLAPIYDPNIETASVKALNYNIDSIQINIHDLSSSDFVLPDEMFVDILKNRNKLYEMFKWLYAIICHYSEHYSCKVTTPSSFIPKCMIPEIRNDGNTTTNDNENIYSIFQQQITDSNRFAIDNNNDDGKGEKLIQNIHKILNSKNNAQQTQITDELQKLTHQELTSLIVLFDNLYNIENNSSSSRNEEDEDNNSECSSKKNESSSATAASAATVTEEIYKFNLSMHTNSINNETDVIMFYSSDDFMENSKMKLLLNLFNRKLSTEISQMPMELFQQVIDENFSTHIIKFVLLILSWFIRTVHTHSFSDTIFFRELQQHRQQLYDELSDLTFKHNGYFIYNNSIVDIVDVFGYYCRNVMLNVDPVFELSFNVEDEDLYLGYDIYLENRVSSEIIRNIEAGCVSAIYQGQFIENTNVDLNRLWARVTIPRNKHRISPLFNLHTATGKSEYLMERCRKHFNNKYHNNFLDSTSLKSNERGIDMARELNSNLIVCIEEFTNLTEKFKQICGHS